MNTIKHIIETAEDDSRQDYNVPAVESERNLLRSIVETYAKEAKLTPPLQKEEVLRHSSEIIKRHPSYANYSELLAVMISNEAWQPVVGSIPFNRRLLLLPKCFRNAKVCPAQIDELGVLCEQCGRCDIGDIMSEAENLGYTVLISEGTTAVSMILSSGQVECIVGVACIHSFEQSFPHVLNDAIPSIAVPLQNSNCIDSQIDRKWLSSVLSIQNNNSWNGRINLNDTKKIVRSWFDKQELVKLFDAENDRTLEIACEWLSQGGKLWRPLILSSFYSALTGKSLDCDTLRKLAVSIECFHKASLAHDDIQDDDPERYGQDALHVTHGMPIALNTGDLLIGLGYQLIAGCNTTGEKQAKLTKLASQGHRKLCMGQGNELLWDRNSGALTIEQTTTIFKYKTSPAFEVAIKMAAILADMEDGLLTAIASFSEGLGIAYQIKDDIDDFESEGALDISALRPSILIAIAANHERKAVDTLIKRILNGDTSAIVILVNLINELEAVEEAKIMFNNYRNRALNSLKAIENVEAKVLMHRLTNRILGRID